jgi:LmbE family N-acetylglucosaminyl deacetylase
MRLHQPSAQVFIPDGVPVGTALARTTHLGIGAHADDLELMATDGILRCFGRDDCWFCGVVVTDGAGSPRSGPYADHDEQEMRAVRRREQRKAAVVGDYGAQVLLDYPSTMVKDASETSLADDLVALITATTPVLVYTHNPADRHDTHVAVVLRVVDALRRVDPQHRPQHLYGVEVWRDLDWLMEQDRIAFDLSQREHLQQALIGLFDSQISGGKRYDLAAAGRLRAHATYQASHDIDTATHLSLALDLTPLLEDPELTPAVLVSGALDRFTTDVLDRLRRLT